MTTATAAPAVPTTASAPAPAVTPMEEYLFDLRGYIILRQAVTPAHVAEMNAILDQFTALEPPLKHGEWYGYVQGHHYTGSEGLNLQQIYEAGEPFERLIDHPSWINHVKHFVGGQGTFDYHHGPLFIDENFANIRGPGEAIGLHSGGHQRTKRTQFRFHNGQFHCGQVNILLALRDIGPGDGGTMLIPGSHKSNLPHPQLGEYRMKSGEVRSVDGAEGSIEVYMNAGDALLFVDATAHGSALRRNPGERRIVVSRYGPSWGNFRHPYRPSEELLARLTPERRKIVQPQPPIARQPNRLPGISNP